MTKTEERHTRRFTVSLAVRILRGVALDKDVDDVRGTLISFSAGGCAIRTAVRLELNEQLLIEVPLAVHNKREILHLPVQIVWGREDYRIDTFHVYGMKFQEHLRDEYLLDVLKEEALAATSAGQHPTFVDERAVDARSIKINKSVA